MLDLGLRCCCWAPAPFLAQASAVPSVSQPWGLNGRLRKPLSCLQQRATALHNADARKEVVQVVALQHALFRRSARRVVLVTLYGYSFFLARCRAWGWMLVVGAVSAHLLLAGFWMTSALVRSRLDFRRTQKASSGSWVLVCAAPGKAVLRKVSSVCSSLRFRYHGQQYELQGVGADLSGTAVPQPTEPLPTLLERRSHGGLGAIAVEERQEQFGSNDYRIAVPPVRSLVLSRLLRPIFLFELASVFVWGLDGYWQFTVLSLGTLMCFEVGAAMARHKSLAQLRAAASPSKQVLVLRSGVWISKPSVDLVPGDIIQVHPDKDVPCDALLLDGSATVSEAALSGESGPVAKFAVPPEARSLHTWDAHHFLYAGTKVLAVQGSKEVASCICAVVKTGFHCKQGMLMRRAMASQESIRDKDTLKVVLLLLGFATFAALQIVTRGKGEHVWLKISIILSFVIQPTLPLLMTYAVQRTLEVLRTKDIICAEPLRVLEAASMSTCLFDKTGTLTTDKLETAGIMLPHLFTEAERSYLDCLAPLQDLQLTTPAHQILWHCQNVMLESGKLLGDPLETAVLEDLGDLFSPLHEKWHVNL